jgi:hypothetical protein
MGGALEEQRVQQNDRRTLLLPEKLRSLGQHLSNLCTRTKGWLPLSTIQGTHALMCPAAVPYNGFTVTETLTD